MTKKLYALISGCIGGVATIATAVVAYFAPAHAVAIIAAIGIGSKAADEILLLFVDEK